MQRTLLITLTILSTIFLTSPITASAHQVTSPSTNVVASSEGSACEGLSQLGGTKCPQDGGEPQNRISNVASNVVELISYIAGIVAIIMIIVAGVKFTTSGGDSQKVSSAKTSLVYALIGLAVAALAQFLVHFVLSNV